MEHLRLQPAATKDADAIAALVNSAYRGEGSRKGWTTEADLLGGQRTDAELIADQLANPDNTILLFRRETELVACVFLQRHQTHAYLGMLTVAPHLQAGGIGKAALALAEEWVQANWQLRRMEMTVIKRREELIAWYVRRGYHVTGKIEPFPIDNPRVGIPKVEDLDMIVLEKGLTSPGPYVAE